MSRFRLAAYSSEPIKKSYDFRSSQDYLDNLLSHCGRRLLIYRPELADQSLRKVMSSQIVSQLIRDRCRVSILVYDEPMFMHNCKDLTRLYRKMPSLVEIRHLRSPTTAEPYVVTGSSGFATMMKPGHWIMTESPAMARKTSNDFDREWQRALSYGSKGQCYL